MAGTQVDDASATEETPHLSRHLPRFIKLLARQTSRVADGASQPVEERAAGKTIDVPIGQAST
jgi:hypothetical protein